MRAVVVAVVAALLLGLALAGCSDEVNVPDNAVTPERDAEGRYVIHLTEQMTFEPNFAKVPAGSTVVWVVDGEGTMMHDVDGYAPGQDMSTFTSWDPPPDGYGRLMNGGESYAQVLDKKGEWNIYCHTHHETMHGYVYVT